MFVYMKEIYRKVIFLFSFFLLFENFSDVAHSHFIIIIIIIIIISIIVDIKIIIVMIIMIMSRELCRDSRGLRLLYFS